MSNPVLSVVGGTLVLGKRFQLLCRSVNGTLPITYNLYGPNRQPETQVVSKQGEEAIFNSSAIYRRSDINKFLCHAKNSQHRVAMTEAGQLLQSTNVIGTSDATMKSAHSNKLMLSWSNMSFQRQSLCRNQYCASFPARGTFLRGRMSLWFALFREVHFPLSSLGTILTQRAALLPTLSGSLKDLITSRTSDESAMENTIVQAPTQPKKPNKVRPSQSKVCFVFILFSEWNYTCISLSLNRGSVWW